MKFARGYMTVLLMEQNSTTQNQIVENFVANEFHFYYQGRNIGSMAMKAVYGPLNEEYQLSYFIAYGNFRTKTKKELGQ